MDGFSVPDFLSTFVNQKYFSRRDAILTLATLGSVSGCVSSQPSEPEVAESQQTPDTALPQLTVDENHLTTATGETVILRGVSIVDPKRGRTTPHRGRETPEVIDLITDADEGWYPTVVRIPVQPVDIGDTEHGTAPTPPAFTQAQLNEYLTTYLDPVIAQCASKDVYAIIDFHRHREEVQWAEGTDGPINRPLQAEAKLFWETVAPRYAEDTHVIYEVYNEPTEPGMWGPTTDPTVKRVWQLFLEFIQPIVDTIRKHTETVTIVSSPGWATSPEGALIQPVTGGNIAYSYHVYPQHEVSQKKEWDGTTPYGGGVEGVYESHPLFVTEFGWRDYDDQWLGGTTSEFGAPLMEWLESSDAISWTAWCADVWWEPAMFSHDPETGDWLLRGRDAGSEEDSGEFIRQRLAATADNN